MTKVCELYNIPKVDGAYVGIELEMEGKRLPGTAMRTVGPESAWKPVEDGSLRQGIELVLKRPMSALEVKAALEEMQGLFEKYKTEPSYSFRTSTHVHVNFSNMDLEVVKVFCMIWYLFENTLVDYCEKGRKGNRFCLRAVDSYDQVGIINGFFQANVVPDERSAKYSALNLCTLRKYGSLEVRTLEGTCNWDRLYLWARTLLRLRKAAKDIGTREKFLSMPTSEIADLVFNTDKLRSTFLRAGWEQACDSQRSYLSDLFRIE